MHIHVYYKKKFRKLSILVAFTNEKQIEDLNVY